MKKNPLKFGKIHSFHQAAEELKKFADTEDPAVKKIFDDLPLVETRELKSPTKISNFLNKLKKKIASVSPEDHCLTINNDNIIFGKKYNAEDTNSLKKNDLEFHDTDSTVIEVAMSGITGSEINDDF